MTLVETEGVLGSVLPPPSVGTRLTRPSLGLARRVLEAQKADSPQHSDKESGRRSLTGGRPAAAVALGVPTPGYKPVPSAKTSPPHETGRWSWEPPGSVTATPPPRAPIPRRPRPAACLPGNWPSQAQDEPKTPSRFAEGSSTEDDETPPKGLPPLDLLLPPTPEKPLMASLVVKQKLLREPASVVKTEETEKAQSSPKAKVIRKPVPKHPVYDAHRAALAQQQADACNLVLVRAPKNGEAPGGTIFPPPTRTNQETFPEFSVTAKRYGAEAACLCMEELPPPIRNALAFIRSLPRLPHTELVEGDRPFLYGERDPAKMTLVLDLDETLVHCSRGEVRPGQRGPVGPPDLLVEFDDVPAFGGVFFRPHVRAFLEEAAHFFEIVVFTASQQAYADKVIDALDPHRELVSYRLYRQHCTELRGAYFKELGLLGRPLPQCILVDNSPISCACDADNSVIIRSWYGDPDDGELPALMEIFKDMLLQGPSVEEYLANRYGLRDFFQALRESTCPRL